MALALYYRMFQLVMHPPAGLEFTLGGTEGGLIVVQTMRHRIMGWKAAPERGGDSCRRALPRIVRRGMRLEVRFAHCSRICDRKGSRNAMKSSLGHCMRHRGRYWVRRGRGSVEGRAVRVTLRRVP